MQSVRHEWGWQWIELVKFGAFEVGSRPNSDYAKRQRC
jgi:hypothetical protein